MRTIVVATLLGMAVPAAALAQSDADLRNAATDPSAVLTYGMSYGQQRFSPLTRINRQTVKRLVPAWTYSMAANYGEESQPLLKDGVIYVTSHDKTVALDALTGKEIWKTMVEYAPETTRVVCCGIVNRGTALYQGKVFRTTLDARVVALDQKTGKEVWSVKSGDAKDGLAMTGAPIVANGVLINGVAGAEFGIRGYLEGYDPETGKRLWRHYTVPRPGEPGAGTWPDNAANASGGSTWTTGSYDPELDLVFWGIGNPAPWNPLLRKGDDLYTNSIIALRPKTGEFVWYYQMSPNDPFDHDGVNPLIQAELNVGGKPTKVVMQAGRNGFFYVLERATGRLIAANKYVKVTWADHIDMKTGRPVWSDDTKAVINGTAKGTFYPNISGGTNWFPPSFSPLTGLAYVNTLAIGMTYQPRPISEIRDLKPGQPHYGVDRTNLFPDPEPRGYLKAIDPLTGKSKWETAFKSPNWSGTLVTAGGLVFTGELTGEFIAVDVDTGKILWQFQTPSGIIGQPITWERDGKQYVTVASGTGGVYVLKTPDPNLTHTPAGGSLWTFKLFEE
ncbi:MAG TPA: PQQ-dependent dehydrogenase, methanol/ethanol family [Acidiferrobacterales bacterium]|nr:PQQ-dependent dehydrogenase, methanol/ethanol family [Acidiferrobacterales bacterium]